MANALEKLTSLEAAISDVVAELYEIFSTADVLADSVACEQALDRYMNRVGRIGMLARSAGLDAVHESSVHFHHILQQLRQRKSVLSSAECDLLEHWPLLVGTCLTAPLSMEVGGTLLDYLGNDLWPCSLPDEVAGNVYAACQQDTATQAGTPDLTGDTSLELVITAPSSQQPANAAHEGADMQQAVWPEPGVPHDVAAEAPATEPCGTAAISEFDADLLDALQQEVLEATEALLDDLDAVAVDGCGEGIEVAFNLCADRMELMLMSAAEVGLTVLADACHTFQANLRALGGRHTALSQEERQTLTQWPLLVVGYLQQPDDTCAAALHDYMQSLPGAAGEDESALSEPEGSADVDVTEIALTAFELIEGDLAEAFAASASDASADTSAVAEVGNAAEACLSESASELIQLVRMELESAAELLSESLGAVTAAGEASERAQALAAYAEVVDRFRIAVDSMGLTGLRRVLDQIHDNIGRLASGQRPLCDAVHELLQQWPALVLAYLDDLADGLHSHRLVEYLQHADWLSSLPDDDVPGVLALLQSPQLITEEEGEPRQTQAQLQDVSLELPGDVNAQLLDSLLQELPSYTAEFSAAISRMVDGSGTLQDVDTAQRIAHTLKGSANTVGVAGIANLTHHIEDILLAFAKHQALPGRALADALLAAADVLEMMSEALLATGPAPEQALPTLQTVLDWANRIDAQGVPQHDDGAVVAADTQEAADHGTHAAPATGSDSGTLLRVPASLVDDLLRLVGESIILTGQLQNRLRQSELQTESVRAQHTLFQQLTGELEHLVETQGLNAAHTRDSLSEGFDTLELERYNELHTVTHRLVEAATDARELTSGVEDQLATLDELLVDQRKLQKDQQELVMRTRMVPVQTMVPRLQRAVRQAGRQTGKQVELEVQGADTLIDSQVLADLIDPLMHLLRNAVDHGIEAPEQRATLGKPAAGQVRVQFHREGDHIVVECRDDGAGLNLDAIRATAEARGLVTPEHELSDEELSLLVLVPGFTTRSATTQVSGRGIGMDAVQSRVSELKGTLHIESQCDQGCSVELRLPLTLISVHALLIRAADQGVAVSSRGVDQILYPGAGVLTRDGQVLNFSVAGATYDAWHLETLLEMPVPADAEQSSERPVLLVRDESSSVRAVCVGQVRATQDMVVKHMGPFVPGIWGIEGTTILGDGSVAPLVDLPMLLRTATHDSATWFSDQHAGVGSRETRPCALVVDDSLSARRSLAQFVQDLGYEVLAARDGLEAIEVMAERLPQIMLVDLEMPRMNGLELAAHVRAQKSTRHIPMIMITSRSTDKHRQQAKAAGVNAYLTKPFSEDELIDQIHAVLVPEASRA